MEFRVRIPFVELLGFELLGFEPGSARIGLTLRDDLTNSWGVSHGGVTMTLLDVAMAHAARTPTRAEGDWLAGVVTIEMKTSFMRPGQGRLVAEGRRLHQTATLAFCEGTVRNEKGQTVGHATGTFKYMKALPVDGRKLRKLNASD